MNILLTAGSRRVPLVQAFRQALRSLRMPGAVIVTDVNPLSPAVHVADRAYHVPMSSDPEFLPELRGICETERIGLIVPTIDDELPLMGREREQFASNGILVAASSESTALLCNDKYETCRHLTAAGVPAATSWLPGELPAALLASEATLPLFIKPRGGRGAVSAFPVRTAEELAFFLGYVPDPVIQEYLAGPEYTLDVLCDSTGTPLSIVPRERVVIRAGVIDRGRTVNDYRLIQLAQDVCEAIPFNGPINIQCRIRGGQPVVFEINPRFSGGIPLTIQAGADFPRMLVKLAAGQRVMPAIGQFRSDLWMTSFESSFFLDAARVRFNGGSDPLLEEVA